VTIDELTKYFPVLYHMAEDGSWESIQRHGLLSTTALLDLFEYSGNVRNAIEARRRSVSVAISHPIHGTAVIRDQAPISDTILGRCLTDMEPTAWYRLLNSRVFFWLGRRRLESLLDAQLYRARPHTVLTVETASLIRSYAGHTVLSRINSGATHRGGSPRGSRTFLSLAEFPFKAGRRSDASIRELVAELAVDYGIPDIGQHVLKVERVMGSAGIETIHESRVGPVLGSYRA
jgi:hypothetical protein